MALSKIISNVLDIDGITLVIKYEGDNSIFVWKHPKEDFNTLSQLIVHENQEALFFKDGQALDLFPAGRYTLSTNNIPILRELINIPTGGKSPFHCEVYFINKTSHMAIRWGTDSQVQYMDPKYNFPLQIGLSGEMILQVNDSRRLVVKIVGTEKNLTQDALVQKFRSILNSKIKPYIANSMQSADYSIFEVDSHMDEFSDDLYNKLISDFDEYGITLQKFMVTSIAKPVGDTAYEKYKEIHVRQYSDIAEAQLRQKTEVIDAETEAKKTVIESQALATKRQQEVINNLIKQESYDEAIKLMDAGEYDAAITAFEELGDFSDSPQKIEEIKTIIKDKAYDEAVQLMDNENYDEAITAFEALDGYKDSIEKIEEIRGIICEQKYAAAEEAYAKGDYETATGLYFEVTPYKDSREKLVEIFNRQSSDKILYLGTYNGEPIAWRIIEMVGYEKMHLLADKPMRDLPVSDDITDTSFEDSDICKWLNGDFLSEFTERDLSQIIDTDGLKISLLSDGELKVLKSKGVDLSCDSDWWLRDEARKGFKYATPDANVESAGDIHVRDKGVRPAIWINLE